VLGFLFGFGAAIGESECVGDEGAKAGGEGTVIAAAIENFAAAGFAVGAVTVDGDHHVAFVGPGDVITEPDGCGVIGIATGADDGVTGGAEDFTQQIHVAQGNVGFFVLDAFHVANGTCVVFETLHVGHSMAGIEADGEGHAAWWVSKPVSLE